MSTQVHCDRCGSPLCGPEPVKSLLVWRWRGGMPADAEMLDMCNACHQAFRAWLNAVADDLADAGPTITVEPSCE